MAEIILPGFLLHKMYRLTVFKFFQIVVAKKPVQSAICAGLHRLHTLGGVERVSILDILEARSRLRTPAQVKLQPTTKAEVLKIFGGKVVSEEAEKRRPAATVAVRYPDTYPSPPIRVVDGVTIADPQRFVSRTIAELERHVRAVNAGRSSYIGKYHLVDEKVRRLALCGVKVEIKDVDDTEAEFQPLKIDLPDEHLKLTKTPGVEHLKIARTESKVGELFAELGLTLVTDDRTGLDAEDPILLWLEKWDEILAGLRKLQETLAKITESERRKFFGVAESLDWTKNATEVGTSTRPLSARELKTVRSLQGKRGGVLCRNCYRPMKFSAVNGGYDWHCDPCGLAWRSRYGMES